MSKDELDNLFMNSSKMKNAKGNLYNWKVGHVTQTYHKIHVEAAVSVFI